MKGDLMKNPLKYARLGTLVLLAALPLLGSCDKTTGKKWDAMSKCVEAYAAANHGWVMSERPATSATFSGVRQWTIVIPVEELSIGKLDAFQRNLTAAVNAVDDTLGGLTLGARDPVIRETDNGEFRWASGPALVLEGYSEGRGGAFQLIAQGLEKDRNGLSGYSRVMKEAPSPGGKWLIRLDLMVMK